LIIIVEPQGTIAFYISWSCRNCVSIANTTTHGAIYVATCLLESRSDEW